MTAPIRLRQMVVITRALYAVVGQLQSELGLGEGYQDRGVGTFGLENRVLPAGDCFVEVLTPVTEQSTGHRYLERHGRDGGYMAIFQYAEREGIRERVESLGIRVVWKGDLPDISGTHLDPRDVPGAIVSLDWADPPESWHWAGPAWTGGTPPEDERTSGGITSLTIAVPDPEAAAARWAAVLAADTVLTSESEPAGLGAREGAGRPGGTEGATVVELPGAGQELHFVSTAAREGGAYGIIECGLDVPGAPDEPVEISGVSFVRQALTAGAA